MSALQSRNFSVSKLENMQGNGAWKPEETSYAYQNLPSIKIQQFPIRQGPTSSGWMDAQKLDCAAQ